MIDFVRRKQLDITKIAFPSDPITFGQIRRWLPELDARGGPSLAEVASGQMFILERQYAQTVYDLMVGSGITIAVHEREMREQLCHDYHAHRLADGIDQANALVDGIVNQVRQQLGRTK